MKKFYTAVQSMISSNRQGLMGMVVQGDTIVCPTGSKLLLDELGQELLGEIKSEILAEIKPEASEIILAKKPRVLVVPFEEKELTIYLEPLNTKTHLVILGGGHIAVPLARMGKLLDYRVTVVDDRPSFANSARFPEVDQVICDDFQKTIRRLAVDNNTYIIIVTRGHQHDRTCLNEVLKKPDWAYTGMIGSRRKVTAVLKELEESGLESALLNRVYTPIGLDIGAQTPEEIAVSIMAEIIMVQHKGFSSGLGSKAGGILSGQKRN